MNAANRLDILEAWMLRTAERDHPGETMVFDFQEGGVFVWPLNRAEAYSQGTRTPPTYRRTLRDLIDSLEAELRDAF